MKHTTCFLAAVAALAFASDGQCAEAASGSQPSAPKTYCNPMPLPGIPVNSGCRNGKPSRTPGSSYREIADPSFLYDNGTLYLYPSMGMAWKSKDCGATWEFIDVGVYDLGYAPTAVKHRGKYYLTTGGSQLHVADSPEGPFKPIGRIARPKVDGKEMSYDDPMLFSDDDERLYVYFGCSPRGGIWGIELDSKNPLAFIGEPKQLIKFEPEEHPWECKPNRLDEAWMEGSWLTKINGRYCLVFSSSGTENNTYAMGAAWTAQGMGLMRPAETLRDLDLLWGRASPPDCHFPVATQIRRKNVAEGGYTTYQDVCLDGWAPAPTNDVQKRIWDGVKSGAIKD